MSKAQVLHDGFFKVLTSEEERKFRAWARNNYDPEVDCEIKGWHPIVRDEWRIIAGERAGF